MSQSSGPGPLFSAAESTATNDSRQFLMRTLTFVLAFIVVASFAYTWYSGSNVATWLQAVLPVVAGLVGGVVGFYFGQQSQQGSQQSQQGSQQSQQGSQQSQQV
jgi:uncharacterized protein HemX